LTLSKSLKRKTLNYNEVGFGDRIENGQGLIEEAQKLHPMFDRMKEWMTSYRPGRKSIPSDQEIERAKERLDWDEACDGFVGEIPRKLLTPGEAMRFENFRATPRTMGISPETDSGSRERMILQYGS